MTLVALMLQMAPQPIQIAPPLNAQMLTLPILQVDCELRLRDRAEGRLSLEIAGGRAIAAQLGPSVGQEITSEFRRTRQVAGVRADELELIPAAQPSRVEIGWEGGVISFQARLFGDTSERWWRLAFWPSGSAGQASGNSRPMNVAIVDGEGKDGYGEGTCSMNATAQRPLTADEDALESDG